MSANTSPVFAITPNMAYAEITATTTDRTGVTTTNVQLLVSAGSNGTKVSQIGCKVEGVSVAGCLLIFISNGLIGSGGALKLFDELIISAVTPSTTAASFRSFNAYSDLELKTGQYIYVGITAISSGPVNVLAWAQQGDF